MYATSLRTRRSCTRNRATRCEELEEVVMNLSFENKVALVTGAASGMGLATAKAFAEAGASGALAGVPESAVRSAAEELVSARHKAIGLRCNVAYEADVAANVEQAGFTLRPRGVAFHHGR